MVVQNHICSTITFAFSHEEFGGAHHLNPFQVSKGVNVRRERLVVRRASSNRIVSLDATLCHDDWRAVRGKANAYQVIRGVLERVS